MLVAGALGWCLMLARPPALAPVRRHMTRIRTMLAVCAVLFAGWVPCIAAPPQFASGGCRSVGDATIACSVVGRDQRQTSITRQHPDAGTRGGRGQCNTLRACYAVKVILVRT